MTNSRGFYAAYFHLVNEFNPNVFITNKHDQSISRARCNRVAVSYVAIARREIQDARIIRDSEM